MNTKQGPHGQRFLSIFKSKGHGRRWHIPFLVDYLGTRPTPVVTKAFQIAVSLYLHFRNNFKVVCSSSNFHLLKRHWHE